MPDRSAGPRPVRMPGPAGDLRDQFAQSQNAEPPPLRPGELMADLGVLVLMGIAVVMVGWGLYTLAEILAPSAGWPVLAIGGGAALWQLGRYFARLRETCTG